MKLKNQDVLIKNGFDNQQPYYMQMASGQGMQGPTMMSGTGRIVSNVEGGTGRGIISSVDVGSGVNNVSKVKSINELFTTKEIENLKSKVIEEGQMLKDTKWGKRKMTNNELGPAIAGVYNKRTGEIYTAINDTDGMIPKELSPIIEKRINDMPDDVYDSYIEYTKGAGSHAEVYAINKALLANPDANIDDLLVYVNRTLGITKPIIEVPFKTCPHCEYILEEFHILSNN